MVEQHTFNVRVPGSNPGGLTNFKSSPHRLARPRTPPFHGGDGGSNPPGDATSFLPANRVSRKITKSKKVRLMLSTCAYLVSKKQDRILLAKNFASRDGDGWLRK